MTAEEDRRRIRDACPAGSAYLRMTSSTRPHSPRHSGSSHGPAHRGDVGEPVELLRPAPRARRRSRARPSAPRPGAVITGTGRPLPGPGSRREGSQQADEGRDPGDRGDEEVRLVDERSVAKEEALGTPANNHLATDAEREERIGELAVRHPLDEQLDLIFERRRADRVGPFDHPTVRLETESDVLARTVRQARFRCESE